ncbi:hypothetical protein FEM48_Zijuj11G0132700 [Ziziphus jujuba var. spinosa]|uniref:Disease resistance protein RPM1-like n=1 Tax=Ziziphus jujuba var. spinosa TaxID=714518 RepID=A0A978UJ55_ZIZJJ|nr:hypothetical protein FEM48_Zijuj11G0132700 [Ziziphus jujuba var. spinosa]
MAESAVSFLLDNLTPLLQNEVQLLWGVHGQVQYIFDELERIKAFLRVADSKEESNDYLRVWVKQVRDVAYDMEDVLDEFMLRLLYYHGHGFSSSLHKLYHFIKSLKARHRIASDMQGIKSRVESISNSHTRFNMAIPGWSSNHEIFTDIRKPVPPEVSNMNIDRKRETIKDFLQQSRYLIVLDGVWDVNDWDFIKHSLPSNNRYGSRIMVTTRNAEVASASCVEIHDKVYNLEPLSPEESWELLCKKTFQGKPCPRNLEEVCHCILNRCGGLPLAIVAISAVLATKDDANIDEWASLCHTFGPEIGENYRLDNMKRVLSLSFNDLPYYLKSCFLYLSMFPDFRKIETMRLIRLWIAEGFVIEKEGMTPEEVAEGYIKELLDRSLIQVAGTTSCGRIKSCKVHDLLREIVIQKSKDQNFGVVVKEQGMLPEKVRRLSVVKTLHNDWIIPDVEVVINYSFPLTTEDDVNRIGQTGRSLKARHRIASDMQLIKSRVNSVSKSYRRFNLDIPRDRKRETIKDFLQQSRYLIVLDDVWDVKFWDTIKLALPSSNKYGSRIIVTTRNASCVEIHDKVYNLEPLSPEESWGLLCKKTFQGKPCPSNLEEICHCILNRCGGLPLAIAAISAVLATKDQANIDEWVHDLLREIAIQKSKDQNFGVVVKEQGVTLPDKVRRLSVVKTLHNVQNKNLSRLRSLFVFNAEDSLTEFPKLFPRSLKLLKVLELRGAPIENFPEEVCKLFYLKFLGLKKTKVKHIPRSIKKLQNLETLNLKDSFVTELPVEILSLKRLRHLLVYRYDIQSYVHFDSKIGVNAPDGIDDGWDVFSLERFTERDTSPQPYPEMRSYRRSPLWKNIKAQYRIALQLQIINARIRDIHAAHKRLRPSFNEALRGSCFDTSGKTWHDRREDALFLVDNDAISIDKPTGQFVEWLINGGSECEKRRYLIVFDDLWNIYEWEAVKYALLNSKNGSKVMITTRKDDVASNSCMNFKGKVYNLKPLSQDKSWELFCRKAFAGNSCPPYLFKICKDILRKCEGLPLAVVALSGVLATKDTHRIDEWDMISRSLGVEI